MAKKITKAKRAKASNKRRYSFTLTPVRIVVIALLVIATVLTIIYALTAGKNVEVMSPQGPIASEEKTLIIFTAALGAVVIVPVFILLFVFAWRYRASNPDKNIKYTPDKDENHILEIIWWGIPITIVVILSVVNWITTHRLDPYQAVKAGDEPVRVQVVGLQWKWLFIYPDEGIAAINELRIPEKSSINFEITADGPMAAFWVPQLGTQIYSMNGMTSRLSYVANNTGQFTGRNTNINGTGYARMNFPVYSMTRADYSSWLESTRQGAENILNWSSYQDLVEPAEVEGPAFFRLGDKVLYSRIIDKYMAGMDHANHDEHQNGNDSASDTYIMNNMNKVDSNEHSEHMNTRMEMSH